LDEPAWSALTQRREIDSREPRRILDLSSA
jgi:hypothetical protein